MNNEQAKHLAGTLRAVAFAQFAVYGYTALQQSDWLSFFVSTLTFIWLEQLALLALGMDGGN